jgi:hypothetical protein
MGGFVGVSEVGVTEVEAVVVVKGPAHSCAIFNSWILRMNKRLG